MTATIAPRTTGSSRRTIGIVLLIVAAITTIPAAIAGVAQATLVPDAAPPEAFLLPSLAAWLMSLTWWVQAALIVIGSALALSAPRRLVPAILAGVVAASWVIAMIFLVTSGMLFAQQA